jgi:hypothetical protein
MSTEALDCNGDELPPFEPMVWMPILPLPTSPLPSNEGA